jgi:flagellar basal-body rod protein FlgC
MSIASAIALSGINAATLRLQVAASNVANARSDGALPDSSNAATFAGTYVPLRVNQTATAGGGTSATVTAASPATVPDKDSSLKARNAEAWAFAANPYVALTNEMVQLLVARFDLVANAHVLRTDTQLSGALFDITA